MGSVTDKLISKDLIKPPAFLKNNVHYEVMMGSIAYGCSNDTSDIDIYGFCIPPKDVIFPHLSGHIQGFGRQQSNRFDQFQKHHIKDGEKEYDMSIYNIVKFFQLVMENNPNMIDSIFVPRRCILHSTKVGEMVRESRKIFLHKGAWFKFKGYAYSQLNKCKNKVTKEWVDFCKAYEIDHNISKEDFENFNFKIKYLEPYDVIDPNEYLKSVGATLLKRVYQSGIKSKRIESIVKYGWDVKFGYHIVRLLNEIEMILTEGDLDLEMNREQLKAIRRGDMSLGDVELYFQQKELELEKLYTNSSLRHSPDEEKIKQLLLDCLEEHYGNIENCAIQPDIALKTLQDVNVMIEKTLRKLM